MLDINVLRNRVIKTNQSGQRQSDFFNFSKLNIGDKVRVRFVEDGDEKNQSFWRTRAVRTLQFDGLLANGQVQAGTVYVDVPAFNLKKNEVDDTLPPEYCFTSTEDVIQNEIQNIFETDPDLYRKFKRREGYLMRGFIRGTDEDPKLTYFIFSPQLYDPLISFLSEEQQEAFPGFPCSVDTGRDFNIVVSDNAGRKSYLTSSYVLKTSSLTDEEKKVLNEHKDDKLYEKMTKKPTEQQSMVMLEMFNAAKEGKPYDWDAWNTTFKPNNAFKDSNGTINIRNNGGVGDNALTDVPTSAVEEQLSALSTPKTISTEEVNEAIKQNTTTANSADVQNMLTQLMAQFNNGSTESK